MNPLRIWRSIWQTVRRTGGWTATIQAALSLMRREGISAVVRATRYAHYQSNTSLGDPFSNENSGNDYPKWVQSFDLIDNALRSKLTTRLSSFVDTPRVSILMPTYNSNSAWLKQTIDSVIAQIYPNWELCIADDCSTDPQIRVVLERYAQQDSRIKITFRTSNGHISVATNSALELATGHWLTFLDHDDIMREHALFYFVEMINSKRGCRLVYSDEDKIDSDGNRTEPYFKPDWNPSLFYSHNYLNHLAFFETELVKAIGGAKLGKEGAQDWDLALRYIEKIQPDQIAHIPRVLYHWRAHSGSTARNLATKSYAVAAGKSALEEHLHRLQIRAQVLDAHPGMRVRYELPSSAPLVSIIVPTRDNFKLLSNLVQSILKKTDYPNFEILIVDNGSENVETLAYLTTIEKQPRVRVIQDPGVFNYSRINNQAVKAAHGQFIALVNDDIEVISTGWLTELVSIAAQPRVGAVGARLWYPNDTLQHGGVILGLGGLAGHAHKYLPKHSHGRNGRARLTQDFSAVTAACLVVSKEAYHEVGGLDEIHLSIAFNDVDFCLRLKAAGYRNLWTPFAELYHHESATRGYENSPAKRARFKLEKQYMQRTWAVQLASDPAYNPNLTIEREDFSLAWPPRISH
jgi:O-antigen biosynthesis protein